MRRFFGAVAEKFESQDNDKELHCWIVFKAYSACVYVVSLRGLEGFLLDLDGLRNHWTSDDSDHIVVALLGKIKGGSHNIPPFDSQCSTDLKWDKSSNDSGKAHQGEGSMGIQGWSSYIRYKWENVGK